MEIREMNAHLVTAQGKRLAQGEVDKFGNVAGGMKKIRFDYHFHDRDRNCFSCGRKLVTEGENRNCSLQRRECILHTLLYGSTWMYCYDLRCFRCGHLTIFDGRESAVFQHSKLQIYSCEILDVLVFQICMLGLTFREGYALMKNMSSSTSWRHARWGGFPFMCSHKRTSDEFAKFMWIIEYPVDIIPNPRHE